MLRVATLGGALQRSLSSATYKLQTVQHFKTVTPQASWHPLRAYQGLNARGGNLALSSLRPTRRTFGSGRDWQRKLLCFNSVAPPPTPAKGASPAVVEELGYEVLQTGRLEEYDSHAILYRHKKTGAEIMSLCNTDENKVFGIVFRTPPKDSTGVPHVLEHSVLCGSRKYPIKEPFVELMKGSLNTFLNAFTYPDRTCYPVASTNLQDFYNLVDVYLDAVLFPRCVTDPQILQQEGWHYELEEPTAEIEFKGVVFNEMKGVYSQPDSVFGRVCQQAVFPDNVYQVDSGGDPAVIPDLTFEQFQDFHRKFYHPSNARIWFYGDDDPDTRLRMLSQYLDLFDFMPSAAESSVSVQPLIPELRRVRETYTATAKADDAPKKQHYVCLCWLLTDEPLDVQTEFALSFLDQLLLGTSGAPLRKELLESRLGEAIVGGGLSAELQQPTFNIGLKGVAEADVEKVQALVMSILERVEKEGFSQESVEAAINTIEFALREQNTGSFPRGLSLMLSSMSKWLYGGDPMEALRFEAPLAELKERLAREGSSAVFSPLIRRYLLDNRHCVTVELAPDTEKGSVEEAAERERLAAVKRALSEPELAALAAETEALRERQETPDTPEALRCVPNLQLSDLPASPSFVPCAVSESAGTTFLTHELSTNNILYADVAFDARALPPHLLPLLPLFCQSLQEMGTVDMDFVELNHLIGRKTGGISVFPTGSAVRGRPASEAMRYVVVRGKAMAGREEDLLRLMWKVLQEVKLEDQKRFRQLVGQRRAGMESGLVGRGHSFAATRIDAMDNLAGWTQEQMGGVSYLAYLRELEKRVEADWAGVMAELEEIRAALLRRPGSLVNLTADERTLAAADGVARELLGALPGEALVATHSSGELLLPRRNEAIVIPTQVNYVAKGANLYANGYTLKGSAHVVVKYLGNTWLWDRVRVSGGAYGGFADFDSHSGLFTYLSYRDPNLLKTLDTYDETAQFLRGLDLDSESLTKAIIGTIGDVDSYQLPDAKGYSSMMRFMLGITEEERQQRRAEILGTSLKDFHEFADALEAVRGDSAVTVVVASEDDVRKANEERGDFLHVQKVL